MENRRFTDRWWDHYKQNFTSIFRGKFFEDFYNMQWAQKPIMRHYVVPKYQLSGSPYHRELTWYFSPKNNANFSLKILDIEVTSLCVKISQTCDELRSCYYGVCFYAIVWKNNSSLGPRLMENGLCKYGDIWINIDKFTPKKKLWERHHIFFRIFTKTRLSKKQFLPVRRYHRALRKWQTGTAMTHLIRYNYESKNRIFEKRSKNTWNIKEKKFMTEKIARMEILKNFQTHVDR